MVIRRRELHADFVLKIVCGSSAAFDTFRFGGLGTSKNWSVGV